MKKLIIILLLIPVLCYSQERIPKDKYYHAGAGILISSSVYTTSQFSKREINPYLPSLAAFSAGFVKEFYDGCKKENFNGKDLLWTTTSGIATHLILRIIWKPKHKKYRIDKDFIKVE